MFRITHSLLTEPAKRPDFRTIYNTLSALNTQDNNVSKDEEGVPKDKGYDLSPEDA
jgi:hypothetical protein